MSSHRTPLYLTITSYILFDGGTKTPFVLRLKHLKEINLMSDFVRLFPLWDPERLTVCLWPLCTTDRGFFVIIIIIYVYYYIIIIKIID